MTGSALKQLADKVTELIGTRAHAGIQGVEGLASALEQVVNLHKQAPYAIGSRPDGSLMLSNGGTQPTPQSQRLQDIREAVLSQYNFTPQAATYIRSLPLDYAVSSMNGDRTWGTYYPNPNTTTDRVAIAPEAIDAGGYYPASTMAHEFLHSMDANINAPDNVSVASVGANSGDSYNFYPNLLEGDSVPSAINEVKNFLSGYPKDDYTRDVEGFARFGQDRGQNVLLTPQSEAYGNIFVPASRPPANMSYKYPVKDNFYNNPVGIQGKLMGD